MSWIVLVLSGMFEAVWATALGASRGLRRPAQQKHRQDPQVPDHLPSIPLSCPRPSAEP